ncbi:hypothetical protein F4Z98_03390 [Candidatus Poribacteria bacterium]|nr:hypothetical protein [Candidatus Poribacteria bacterium]MYA99407.1 hypothetical protein [Candidatus Poribacteria bacterium]
MSETQSTLFNRRRKDAAGGMRPRSVFSCGLLIAGALVLLLIVVVERFLASAPVRRAPSAVRVQTFPPPRREVSLPPPRVLDVSETYYRTIIENNLFRPLGWRPPRPIEPYRLLGTKLSRDANTPPQAILQTTAGEKTYIVTTGEKIDADTEVVSIESKAVTLSTNGEQRTLHLPSGF